uniref:Uncharacterized protein n=1 Tax=Oryza barthii TaxID=65489 RepID=A0A0D3FU37_9ORYZ
MPAPKLLKGSFSLPPPLHPIRRLAHPTAAIASPSSLTADAVLDDTIKIIADAVRSSFKAPSSQAGDAISSTVPPPVPPTTAPSTTAIPPLSASTPAPAVHLPPEILVLLARLGITTTLTAPTQDAAVTLPALDAEAIANLHSQAVLNVKALVPSKFKNI